MCFLCHIILPEEKVISLFTRILFDLYHSVSEEDVLCYPVRTEHETLARDIVCEEFLYQVYTSDKPFSQMCQDNIFRQM